MRAWIVPESPRRALGADSGIVVCQPLVEATVASSEARAARRCGAVLVKRYANASWIERTTCVKSGSPVRTVPSG